VVVRADEIRSAYLEFFAARGHAIIPRAALVPREDPTTLFTGSGMQPLVPYLLGAEHPSGTRLANSQPCFRAEDIDEVGDARHTTFFEMLGNWSLGDYFKKEQIPWLFAFLTEVLGLEPAKLYVTVFAGSPRWGIPRDDESAGLWRELFAQAGIEPTVGEHRGASETGEVSRISFYDESKCWWSRSGPPESMPEGEPGGPDSEVFYLFDSLEHDRSFGPTCHVHCGCGRFVEIGNSVFMEYKKQGGGFTALAKRNVDFGGGLERLSMAVQGQPDVFATDLLAPVVAAIEDISGRPYESAKSAMRIIADHMRAVAFLACDGVRPSNTDQGYVMRRFMRRIIRQGMAIGIEEDILCRMLPPVVEVYRDAYPELAASEREITEVLAREEELFRRTLARGLREFDKLAGERLEGRAVFTLFDTYGFPPELSIEEAHRRGVEVAEDWRAEFDRLMTEQRERSRTAAKGMFKGGLADHSEETTKLHTATHLLYKALRMVLGDHVIQRGSNITPERLRFDFSHPRKMTPEEIAEVERIVNQAIEADYPMTWREMTPEQAFAEGALGAFGDRYGEIVKVYTAGDPDGEWFSKEICGGPHVPRTGVLGRFKIVKEESSSAGVRRIKAVLLPKEERASEQGASAKSDSGDGRPPEAVPSAV
jgi:alanyl-tRNA synthetase